VNFRFARHAEEEISRREIPRRVVEEVLRVPEDIVPGEGGRKVYQSRHKFGRGKTYLVGVIVDDRMDPPLVITAYRTSKIAKYRRNTP
jgi:hypothetical protein